MKSHTNIYRLIFVENLRSLIQRNKLHAPNNIPPDGLPYLSICDTSLQMKRAILGIPCGPEGKLNDYVSFYFGNRSPMLYRLHTGSVKGYSAGQSPLVYVVSSVETMVHAGKKFVFSDGHSFAGFTKWYSDLNDLDKVDWQVVRGKYWHDTAEHPDRQRRKQAEFLVFECVEWKLVEDIATYNQETKQKVNEILSEYPNIVRPTVSVKREWYF